MFRTLTIAALTATLATGALAGNLDHLYEGNGADRQLARFIEENGTNGDVTLGSKGTGSVAQIAVQHLAEGDGAERKLAGFINDAATGVVSTKGAPSVSALEVALTAALESDDRQLARHIAAQLGR